MIGRDSLRPIGILCARAHSPIRLDVTYIAAA